LAGKEILGKKKIAEEQIRTQKDISMSFIVFGLLISAILLFLFFQLGVVNNFTHAISGILIVLIISFLFTTVAATAIAIVGTNPVSG
jgi:uncharacterized oligopeptide transporter (OPT) family protein